MPRKLTTEEFIKKARSIHGDRYDYSLVEYVKSHEKVKIICKEHGLFAQTPDCHINGKHGCSSCAGNKKSNTEEFIQKAKSIHGDMYDYSLVEYGGTNTKVTIFCKEHGCFEQTPKAHLRQYGCPSCSGVKRLTNEEFISKAQSIHGDRYDYSLVEYIKAHTKVKIICPLHGVFEQRASNHIGGKQGCSKCGYEKNAIGQTLTTEEFITKAESIHGNRYSYSFVDYVDANTKVKIICPKHGTFKQVAIYHLSGRGCSKCTSRISKPEIELQEYIKSIYPHKVITNTRKIVYPYELDIYLPDINLAIEFNGDYWHSSEDAKRRDKETKRLCKQSNIRLMIVWERYWKIDKEKVKFWTQKTIKTCQKIIGETPDTSPDSSKSSN